MRDFAQSEVLSTTATFVAGTTGKLFFLIWAVILGGAKRMGGGKRTREYALPKIFWTPSKELLVCSVMVFCYKKTEH